MTATPLIPGRAYRVTGNGLDLIVLTTNPMRAIVLAIKETTICSQ